MSATLCLLAANHSKIVCLHKNYFPLFKRDAIQPFLKLVTILNSFMSTAEHKYHGQKIIVVMLVIGIILFMMFSI